MQKETYLTSREASVFINKAPDYLRELRSKDNKRMDRGEEPIGPAYYKRPGKRNSTSTVLYSKQDLLDWMVTREVGDKIKHCA